MLVGLTALSEEIKVKFLIEYLYESLTRFCVPKTLFFTAEITFSSTNGTCLYAAAW